MANALGQRRAGVRGLAGISAAASPSGCWARRCVLPSVATWWCGEKPALDYVLAHLDRLVIKPTYPNQRFEPVFGRNLEGEARRRLIAAAACAALRLRRAGAPVTLAGAGLAAARRARFRSERRWPSACMPSRHHRAPRSCPAAWRASPRMPPIDVVSTQRGGGSKDIWVLPDSRKTPSAAGGRGKSPRRTGRARRHPVAAGRESVLVRPLHRALRRQGAPAARHDRGARSDEAVWTRGVRILPGPRASSRHRCRSDCLPAR